TSLSILLGMIVGGLVFQLAGGHGPQVAATLVILLAIAGNAVARRIPKVDAGNPGLKIDWNPLRVSWQIWQLTRQRLAVRNAVLGVSWFWFVGTILTAQLPVYAQANLGGTQNLYIFALALFSVGAGIGSMSCEKLSGRTVEIGLVPLGALGISAFLLDLYFARPGQALAQGMTIEQFAQAPGSLRIILDLCGVGLFTGFFVVPLFALIQSRTPKSELARVIAGMNIQNAMFIVLAALLGLFVQRVLHWTIPQLFLALAIANTLVTLWIFTIVPEFLMRFLSWLLVRTLYRLRLHGIEDHVPDEGAALLVCNHVSYMDALVLSACIPRPARFVMYYKIFNIPVLRWIFKTAKTIPIAGAREDPDVMQRAFDAVDAALAEGELVCIFPEGALTKDGEIAPFRPGMERILERAAVRGQAVPVVPLALKNMWGSMWSKQDSRLRRARLPRRLRARIEVLAGEPVESRAATAALLEAKVRALRGDAA
ncbi:1-acyl-sn-glycerol-3-phosphate acyltransferase, partial [Thermomonas sp.]|uniref:1-acyl-sn-glycerol-3-phosphate acyltransferase n=1 Tax=Thermomonas sp. TaxID=1971895 RepID=UPI0026192024